jgi:hypothetical protein
MTFSNDDCDSSLDSYDSFQLMQSDHLHDTDEDDDLAKVMLGSPVTEDFSVPFAGMGPRGPERSRRTMSDREVTVTGR